jgi:transposase-like protein
MTRQQYDAAVKARAMAWVARKTKPASVIAEELGVPRQTLYRWMEATHTHPDEALVGHGPRSADDPRLRDLERAVHGLDKEQAILTKAMRRVACSVTQRCQVLQVSRSGDDAWAARPPSAPAARRQDRWARMRTVDAGAAGG